MKRHIDQVHENFLGLDGQVAVPVAEAFVEKLEDLMRFFSTQTQYHFYASSLLFVYDSASLDVRASVRLKMIDFAHVFPGRGKLDENFINGLINLTDLFKNPLRTR